MRSGGRIFLISSSLLIALAAGIATANRQVEPPIESTPVSKCIAPVSAYKKVGPAMSVEQLEARSLQEMKEHPDVPQVPFGYENAAWLELKEKMRPGDTLHDFETDVTGGVILVRGDCAIDQLTGWIR